MDRVAKVLLTAGSHGTCQADWLAPNVVDGRGQVTRLASRIAELKAAGWSIRTAGRRRGFLVYVAEPSSPPTTFTPPERVVGAAPPRNAILLGFDEDDR